MWDGPDLARLYDRISDIQFEGGRRLLGMMGVRKGDAVLDVGCGTGRLAVHISDVVGPMGCVRGMDPSPYRVRVAEEKRKVLSPCNLQFSIGQGEDLSAFTGNAFDRVVYSSVIHWIGDKDAALKEAYRVLKPGGSVGMNTVDKGQHFAMRKVMDDIIARNYPEHREIESSMMKQLVDKKELEDLLHDARFRDVRIEIVPEKHFYSTPRELFDFIDASSFGNFMRDMPDDVRKGVLKHLGEELEKLRTPEGIELESNMLYATGAKPA